MRPGVYSLIVVVLGCSGGGGGDSPSDAALLDAPPADAALSPDAPDAALPDAPPPFDCTAIPQPPFETRLLDELGPVEDLAFDAEGNMLWSDHAHLYKSTYEQATSIFIPNLDAGEGIRVLSTGDVMIADRGAGALLRIDTAGNVIPVVNDLDFPDGIEVGLDDMVYLTVLGEDRVIRVDPFSGEHTAISHNQFTAPDGITFNEDYTALYMSGVVGDATIYRLPISADGVPGEIEVWSSLNDYGSGWLDGLSVDICGNVYAADLYASKIFRISPDGQTVQTVLDNVGHEAYMTVVQWGSGVGGWDPLKIYIPDVGVGTIELDLGVPEKLRHPAP